MEDQPDDYAALKRRLLGRIAFAVVVLAALLASLAVFDRMNAPEPAPEKPAIVQQGPKTVPPMAKLAGPDTITSEQTRPAPVADMEPVAPVAAVPEGSSTPQTSSLPVPPGEKPLTKPATGRHVLMRSAEPSASLPPRADVLRDQSSSRSVPAAPTPRSAEAVPPPRPVSQVADRPFALQLGVFSDLANAEELRSKLEKAGIKATIEARVQVGPFATRAEADAARAKLRELGISEAMLVGMKGRKGP